MPQVSSRPVYVVDDDETLCRTVAALFGGRGFQVATFGSAEDFLAVVAKIQPGCVLADVRLPGLSGLDLVRRLKEQRWPGPIVMMSGFGDIPLAVESMKSGAADYIQKPFGIQQLVACIETAFEHHEAELNRADEVSRYRDVVAALSPRQREVLQGILEGKLNKVIAHELGLSPRTVESYRANVMAKTKVASLSELIRMAVLAGL